MHTYIRVVTEKTILVQLDIPYVRVCVCVLSFHDSYNKEDM